MLTIFLLIFGLAACDAGQQNDANTTSTAERSPGDTSGLIPAFDFHYNLEQPDQIFNLPNKLREISGLSLSASGKQLAAIQDEDGLLFFIDKTSGEVEEEIAFWKRGDYEGIEVVGKDIFIIKSSGTIYCVKNPGKKNQEVEKYNFFLTHDNDVEGLGHDKKNNRLLLACKAKAGRGKEYKLKKGIYAFDLATHQLDSVPVFVISLEEIQDYLDTAPSIRKLEKLVEFFHPDHSEFTFSPSAIAIHPLNGNVYIASSAGKILLVLSPGGKILHIEKLKKKLHKQPEGLCFDQDGTLFIANEGNGGVAKIYRFNYMK